MDEEVNPDVFTALGIINTGCQILHGVHHITMWMVPRIIEEAIYMECLVDLVLYIHAKRPALVPELIKEVIKQSQEQETTRELVSV